MEGLPMVFEVKKRTREGERKKKKKKKSETRKTEKKEKRGCKREQTQSFVPFFLFLTFCFFSSSLFSLSLFLSLSPKQEWLIVKHPADLEDVEGDVDDVETAGTVEDVEGAAERMMTKNGFLLPSSGAWSRTERSPQLSRCTSSPCQSRSTRWWTSSSQR